MTSSVAGLIDVNVRPPSAGDELAVDQQVGLSSQNEVMVLSDIVLHQVVRPPLTPRTWPVMYDDSSSHRNTTALAMSSGLPARRTGVRLA